MLAHDRKRCQNSVSMKFGRNLPRNQVPERVSSYINYNALKRLIKTAAESSKESSDVDLVARVVGLWW